MTSDAILRFLLMYPELGLIESDESEYWCYFCNQGAPEPEEVQHLGDCALGMARVWESEHPTKMSLDDEEMAFELLEKIVEVIRKYA